MTEEELFAKYGLEEEEAPDRVINVELPYYCSGEIKHFASKGWRYEAKNREALPGQARGAFGPAESIEDAALKIRKFAYGDDDADKDEPSLMYLWKHGFRMDDDDSNLFTFACLRVRKKAFKNHCGNFKTVWKCQAVIDGQMTKYTDATTAFEAVKAICGIHDIELPEEVLL